MHKKSYTVVIDKPVAQVFLASLDPKNTPLWIDGIAEEQSSEFPPKLGTTYRNRGQTGDWSEYTITEFEQDAVFTLSRNDQSFHVRYTFKPLDDDRTEFTYTEWEDKGELKHPMPEEAIQKFKQLVES